MKETQLAIPQVALPILRPVDQLNDKGEVKGHRYTVLPKREAYLSLYPDAPKVAVKGEDGEDKVDRHGETIYQIDPAWLKDNTDAIMGFKAAMDAAHAFIHTGATVKREQAIALGAQVKSFKTDALGRMTEAKFVYPKSATALLSASDAAVEAEYQRRKALKALPTEKVVSA